MNCARINKVCKCHLVNAPQALIVGILNDIKVHWMVYCSKTIYGLVDDFSCNGHDDSCCVFVKAHLRITGKSTIAGFQKLNLKARIKRLYWIPRNTKQKFSI